MGFDILIDTGTFNLIYLANVSNQFSDSTVYRYTALLTIDPIGVDFGPIDVINIFFTLVNNVDRSGPTFCLSGSGFILFAKVINR